MKRPVTPGVPQTDEAALERAITVFFEAFTSGPGCQASIEALRELFLPRAIIVRTCGFEPVVYGVEEFLAPRQELLTNGTLLDFHEWPLYGRIDIFGDIAQWFGAYAKEGVQSGQPFRGRGMKTIHFIRTEAGWRISAAAWDDERDGHPLTSDRPAH